MNNNKFWVLEDHWDCIHLIERTDDKVQHLISLFIGKGGILDALSDWPEEEAVQAKWYALNANPTVANGDSFLSAWMYSDLWDDNLRQVDHYEY